MGEVVCFFGRGVFVDQVLDVGIVVFVVCCGVELLCWVGLQQVQYQVCIEQFVFQVCLFGWVGGMMCVGGDVGYFGQCLGCVEIVVQGCFDVGGDYCCGFD